MAHFCVFCEQNFQTFTVLRRHKCPSNCSEETTFDHPESDKENETFLVNKKVKMSTAISHSHFQQEMKMNETGNSYNYMMEFYHDAGNRNEKEMNITEIKDDSSNTGNSDDSMERCANGDGASDETGRESGESFDPEDSNSVDSYYVYTLDSSDAVDSEQEKTNVEVETSNSDGCMDTDDQSKDETEDALDSTGYVYVLESDNSVHKQSQVSGRDSVENEASLSAESVDTQRNVSVESSCQSNSAVLNVQTANTKEQTMPNSESIKPVGASKRKRKFCLENAITQIKKTKLMDFDDGNKTTDTETKKEEKECVINGENVIDLSIRTNNSQGKHKEEKYIEDKSNVRRMSDILPEDLTVSKKVNRRKSSFVARCYNVEESYERTNKVENKTAESKDQPLDFSIQKLAERKPDVPSKAIPITTEKTEAIDLTVSSINKNDGTTKAKINANAPVMPSRAEFMNWMKKFSPNVMNQNMMVNMLQFQLWMQTAAVNNALGNKNAKTVEKNDINKNAVLRDILTGQAIPDMTKPGLNGLAVGQVLNTAKPGLNGLAAGQVLNTVSPHTPRRRKPKSDLVEMNLAEDTPKTKYEVKEDSDEPIADGITNWTPDAYSTDPNLQPLLSFREKDGEAVRFFVKDNEQVKDIVTNLIQAGTVGASEMRVGLEEMKFICRICDQRFFHVEHLTKHIKQRHIQKKYQCSLCDRSFHDAGNYRQHMRVHDANDVPYECPECQRRFRHKCTLKVHMRIHTGEKPFKCEICQASFKISSGLQTHMRKHTGETPYACEFCNMRFKCQSNLKQHLFQHTQARPFTCEICRKNYSRKSIRDSHMQTHFK